MPVFSYFCANTINVAISAPPRKVVANVPVSINKMLGVGKPKSSGLQKPRISLIPTAVQKNIACTAQSLSNGNNEKPKTNEDFRKLLNK